jgi:hypothetical protein
VALGRAEGERQGTASPDAGTADNMPVGQRPAPGQGDGQRGQVDPGTGGVARLDSARVALDEPRLAVDMEVIEGQPAVPAQMLTQPGRALAGGRVIDAEPCRRRPAGDQPTTPAAETVRSTTGPQLAHQPGRRPNPLE